MSDVTSLEMKKLKAMRVFLECAIRAQQEHEHNGPDKICPNYDRDRALENIWTLSAHGFGVRGSGDPFLRLQGSIEKLKQSGEDFGDTFDFDVYEMRS